MLEGLLKWVLWKCVFSHLCKTGMHIIVRFRMKLTNGDFALRGKRSLYFVLVRFFLSHLQPVLCPSGSVAHYCSHLQVARKQSNAVVSHL